MLIGRTLIDARVPIVLLIARDMTGKGQIPNPARILILTGIGSGSWLAVKGPLLLDDSWLPLGSRSWQNPSDRINFGGKN
jgi:hypothetical protein